MDALIGIFGWLWWLFAKLFGLLFGLVWFLLGGWVSALAQIVVIGLLIFGYKYGWRQALPEILNRARPLGRQVWGWVRRRERGGAASVNAYDAEEKNRQRRSRRGSGEPGDVNLSTLLSVVMLLELATAVVV